MRTYIQNNGAINGGRVEIRYRNNLPEKDRTATTNVRNLNKSHKTQRLINERDSMLNEFGRVLGNAIAADRAEQHRANRANRFAQFRNQK